ncbi:MAG: GGDEF domain-containing protein, partial [Gammaproteobacteria bacterium]|nr:GGDEF domain-containing protein [Gammaproteobacteria bacterium]
KGIYTGLWIALIVLNLILILTFRQNLSLAFTGILLFFGIYYLAPLGVLNNLMLEPRSQAQIVNMSLIFGLISLNLLASKILQLKNSFTLAAGIMDTYQVIFLCILPAVILLPPSLTTLLAGLVTVSFVCILVLVSLLQHVDGIKSAARFLFSCSFMIIATVLVSLGQMDIIPHAAWYSDIGAVGFLFMCITLGVTLFIQFMNHLNKGGVSRGLVWAQKLRTDQLESRLEQLSEDNNTLREFNLTDALTGVKNRRFFELNYDQEWRRAAREKYPLTLIMIDIDHFKYINDDYGHLAGDNCLRRIGRELNSLVKRPGDILARYGGEEFVAVLPRVSAENAEKMADEIRQKIKKLSVPSEKGYIQMTVSAGIYTQIPDDSTSPYELFAKADAALYQAKNRGRDQVFSPLTSSSQDDKVISLDRHNQNSSKGTSD